MSEPSPIILVDALNWTDAIPWALVVMGWLVALAQAGRHDDRADARASIDRIMDLLAELESKAITYHVSDHPSVADSLEIRALLKRISSHITHLNLLRQDDLRKIAYLRQSVTLRNFDTAHHVKQNRDSELLQEIGFAISDVSSSLEEQYNQKFVKKFLRLI